MCKICGAKKLPKKFKPKIVTANDLEEGDVVYFTKNTDWSRSHSHAVVCYSRQQADELLAQAEQQQNIIVGPYLVDVILQSEAIVPLHFREIFRSKGPSNYFHGKQATSN